MIAAVAGMMFTTDQHSGYEFPWSVSGLLPFATDSSYHTYHHFQNVGNYAGMLTIWDTLFDDNKEYFAAYPEGSRVNEHQIPFTGNNKIIQ